jgi:hypothetical protein
MTGPTLMLLCQLLMFLGMLILAIVVSRAAYRNGVLDGWRACESPLDPLWRRKLKAFIDKRRPGVWDVAAARHVRAGLVMTKTQAMGTSEHQARAVGAQVAQWLKRHCPDGSCQAAESENPASVKPAGSAGGAS